MKYSLINTIAIIIPDILLIAFIYFLYAYRGMIDRPSDLALTAGVFIAMIMRIAYFIFWLFHHYLEEIKFIEKIISEFKKGKFLVTREKSTRKSEFNRIYRELIQAGKHLDKLYSSQQEEINTFMEFYDGIIFSLNSYFVIFDLDNRVIFSSKGFNKKFQLTADEINGKKIEDIFYFVNSRLRGGIEKSKKTGKSVVLEKTHLTTLKKTAIIADIKISPMLIKRIKQVIMIVDDVTGKLKNDLRYNLMGQITESIEQEDNIDRILHKILTGVTSGSGLGFNRAMLFLLDDSDDTHITGRMAVGPDSFEEAIDIWNTVASDVTNSRENAIPEFTGGIELLARVLQADFSLEDDTIFSKVIKNNEIIHIADAFSDERVSHEIREFIDAKEFIVIPLLVVNRAIGFIVADNKFNQTPITKESIELLSVFASQAAMSIESYRGLDRAEKEMKKLGEKQNAIIESEKMAAVGRIAAHLAHEIRNPLVTMGGFARRIIKQSERSAIDGKEIKKYAEIIREESDRLEKTLFNVMDFTKPAQKTREFNNINNVVVDTIKLLQNIFQEKQITIKSLLCEELPLVQSDFNQLKQVMLNLIQNAIDATPPGGMIEVITEYDKENITILIRDTGSGIDEEDPSIIFEPFFTTKITGVGLGLAIVKKIIADHNGTISAVNRDDVGAEFVIRLSLPG